MSKLPKVDFAQLSSITQAQDDFGVDQNSEASAAEKNPEHCIIECRRRDGTYLKINASQQDMYNLRSLLESFLKTY